MGQSEKFKIGNVSYEKGDLSMSHRFTLDYIEDYQFIKTIYDELYPINPQFDLNDILNLLDKKPNIMQINQHLNGVNWYRNHINELKTISEKETNFKN